MKSKKINMHTVWVSDRKGSRIYGSKEFMTRNLNSSTTAMQNSKNDFEFYYYAIAAAHWALALEELSEENTDD